jgi:hypothetical protein
MEQELSLPKPSYFSLISGVAVIIIAILLIEFFLFKKKKYSIAIGGLVGIVLAIANVFMLGIIGGMFTIPFRHFLSGGEEAWGQIILIGSIILLLLGYVVGWIIEKIKK